MRWFKEGETGNRSIGSGMGCGGVIKPDFRNSRAAKWGHKRLLEGGDREGQGLCGGRTEQEERGEEESPSDSE